MRFLIEAVYCMTWISTLHRAHNQWKSPIEEDNVWATLNIAIVMQTFESLMLQTCSTEFYDIAHIWSLVCVIKVCSNGGAT